MHSDNTRCPCSLRRMLGAGDWLLVSRGSDDKKSVQGVMRLEPNLHDVQFKTYNKPTILVVEHIAGVWVEWMVTY